MTELLLLRPCKHPKPKAHPPNTMLPSDVFRTIQLQYPPELYLTDNCWECLYMTKEYLSKRHYELSLEADLELVEYRAMPIRVVEAAIQYLTAPPETIKPRTLKPEQQSTNREEYEQIRTRFPARTRTRSVHSSGRSKPQVAENNRRLQEAIRSGVWVQKFEEQMGRCACCQEAFTHHPHLDHDHRTLKIRGLLCGDCNLALGFAHDSVERLQQLSQYLSKWTK